MNTPSIAKNLTKYHLFGLLVIMVLHIPLFILGENSYIHVSDNLNLDHLFHHLLKKSNHLFCLNPDHEIEFILNGIKTSTFHSSFNLINIFYLLLTSYWAYVANSFVVKIIGFLGAYWLVKNCSKIDNQLLIWLIALFYATIPVFVVYGISISGLPILFMAFLSLAKEERVYPSLLIIVLFTFYSHFFLVGPFIVFTVLVIGVFNFKNTNALYWKGLALFVFLSFLFNYGFIYNHLFGEVSHRQEYGVFKRFSFFESSLKSVFLFLKGHYNFSQIFILPILLLMLINKKIKSTYLLITLIFFLCLLSGFYETIISLFGDDFKRPFDFSRFIILVPLLILFVILRSSEGQIQFKTTILILSMQIIINVCTDEDIGKNIIGPKNEKTFSSFINKTIIDPLNANINHFPIKQISDFGFFGSDGQLASLTYDRENTSYKNFYCETLFKEITTFINEENKSFRTINVGFPPSISQYNGFYTLDGYHNYYPLSYKKEFSKIIIKEIEKDKGLLTYFQTRANTCFLLSSELAKTCGYNCNKFNSLEIKINDLEIDTSAFKQMNGKYLMSSVEIINFEKMGFNFLRSFKSQDCDFIIYLYSVKLIQKS